VINVTGPPFEAMSGGNGIIEFCRAALPVRLASLDPERSSHRICATGCRGWDASAS